MFLLLFLQVNVAILVIRKRYGDKLDYGFVMPFHPVLPVLNIGLISFLALFMFHFSAVAWFFVIGWMGAGFVLYRFYAQPREREVDLTPIVLQERALVHSDAPQVLVPVANPASAKLLLDFAARIARPLGGELVILHAARVPPQTPLSSGRRALARIRPAIDKAAAVAEELGVPCESVVRVTHEPWRAIVDTTEDHQVGFVIMGWRGPARHPDTHVGSNLDRVLKYANCHLAIVQQTARIPVARILVPVANPRNAALLASIGRLLMDESKPDSRVTVLHVVPPTLSKEVGDQRIEALRSAILKSGVSSSNGELEAIAEECFEFKLSKSKDAVRSIASRTKDADLLILGSARENWLKRTVIGRTPYRIASRSACPVIMMSPQTNGIRFSAQAFFNFFREEPER
jgi:nucleotide-binding universal stress UspA family protein